MNPVLSVLRSARQPARAAVGALVIAPAPAVGAAGATGCAAQPGPPGGPAGWLHAVHAGERPERDPARGPHRAGGHGERLVPRRVGPRETGPHGFCPPVRAPDVHGLRARQGGRVRPAARGGRRRQQRLDQRGPHQLLDQRPVERARARAVPRVRPHGLPARRDDAGQRGRPAGRGQERAAPELREPPVRHGLHRARRDAVPGEPPLPLADDRLHAGPHGGAATRTWWSSSGSTTRRTTPACRSRATSTSRRRARWWSGGSAR